MLPNILQLDTTPPPTRQPPPQLPNDLARAPTMFVRWDGQVPPLQPLYDGPYTVICCSLHFFTLRIGDKVDKVDKVSTLRLKPCTDPTAPPGLPRVRGRPPAAVCFWDFPPPGAAAARRVHFPPQQPAKPRRELFSPGTPPGVFARPAAVLDTAAARPARYRRAPSRLDLQASDLEAWGEPCRGSLRDDLRGLRICYAAFPQYSALTR